jgi:hypothetical protein
MESVSSCSFFSQVLSCLTNSFSFFLNCHFIFKFWDSVFCLFYSAGMVFHFVLHFCFILFSEVFNIMGYFLFNIVNFWP